MESESEDCKNKTNPKEMLLEAGDRISLRSLINSSVAALADLGNRVAVVEYRGHDEKDDLRAKGTICVDILSTQSLWQVSDNKAVLGIGFKAIVLFNRWFSV